MILGIWAIIAMVFAIVGFSVLFVLGIMDSNDPLLIDDAIHDGVK